MLRRAAFVATKWPLYVCQTHIKRVRFSTQFEANPSPHRNNSNSSESVTGKPLRSDPEKEQSEQPRQTEHEPRQHTVDHEHRYKELHHSYLSVLADMENLRVRTRREVDVASHHSITRFAKDLLSVVDVLELALESAKEANSIKQEADACSVEGSVPSTQPLTIEKSFHDLQEGIEMTYRELLSILKRHGIEPIQVNLGDLFNPNEHTALFQVPQGDASASPNTIVSIQKRGYRIKDRILRHTGVGVAV